MKSVKHIEIHNILSLFVPIHIKDDLYYRNRVFHKGYQVLKAYNLNSDNVTYELIKNVKNKHKLQKFIKSVFKSI